MAEENAIRQLLNERLQEIETALDRCSEFGGGCPDSLKEAIRYSLLAQGKRTRPTLTLLATELCGGDYRRAIPVAVAVEMIHCYSLVHDDLPAMDDDDLRRGQPTCHKNFGEATAILVGDALLTRAFEVLSDVSFYPPEFARFDNPDFATTVVRCSNELSKAAGACGMVGGQEDDIKFANQNFNKILAADFSFLESIHERKTGAMIVASLKLGGIVAGASDERLNLLEKIGKSFGLSFQIVDDILDFVGDEQDLGKRVHKDADQGKLTFATYLGIEKSREIVKNEEAACFELLGRFPQNDLASSAIQQLIHDNVLRDKNSSK